MTWQSQRGATLIEVMIAGVLLTVSMAGFVGAVVQAGRSTQTANVRTAVSLLRTGTLDRVAIVPRDGLTAFPSTYRIERCFDGSSQELPAGRNSAFADTFACPGGTVYRTWVKVEAQANPVRTWKVAAYAEKLDPGCSAETAASSLACSVGQQLLTD